MKQLSLLDWSPAARLYVFPLCRRRDVSMAADTLLRVHGEAANRYWRDLITAMKVELSLAGVDQRTIRAELNSFFDAVQAELQHRAYRGQRPGGGAA